MFDLNFPATPIKITPIPKVPYVYDLSIGKYSVGLLHGHKDSWYSVGFAIPYQGEEKPPIEGLTLKDAPPPRYPDITYAYRKPKIWVSSAQVDNFEEGKKYIREVNKTGKLPVVIPGKEEWRGRLVDSIGGKVKVTKAAPKPKPKGGKSMPKSSGMDITLTQVNKGLYSVDYRVDGGAWVDMGTLGRVGRNSGIGIGSRRDTGRDKTIWRLYISIHSESQPPFSGLRQHRSPNLVRWMYDQDFSSVPEARRFLKAAAKSASFPPGEDTPKAVKREPAPKTPPKAAVKDTPAVKSDPAPRIKRDLTIEYAGGKWAVSGGSRKGIRYGGKAGLIRPAFSLIRLIMAALLPRVGQLCGWRVCRTSLKRVNLSRRPPRKLLTHWPIVSKRNYWQCRNAY